MLGKDFYLKLREGINEVTDLDGVSLVLKHKLTPNKRKSIEIPIEKRIVLYLKVLINSERDKVIVNEKFYRVFFDGSKISYKDFNAALEAKRVFESIGVN